MDVDAMLDELEPHQFDEWVAYRTLEPDPVERIVEILKRGFTALVLSWGGELDPDDLDPKDFSNDKRNEAMSPAQSAAMARQAISRGRG